MLTAETLRGLETKFVRLDQLLDPDAAEAGRLKGYASLFGVPDQSGDVVAPGAFRASLARLSAEGRRVKFLWQHDPAQPIGIWDKVREDERGLYVKGRLVTEVSRAREAACLIEAGALDGLSIGYRTVMAQRDEQGRRLLTELDLWEVSVVTFPMLPQARIGAKAEAREDDILRDLATALQDARRALTGAA
ncbi:MAG: HK97 family phage prohead protease [Paracoccaceae bacterium]